MLDQSFEAVERIDVAEKLQRQLFLFDNVLGDPRPLRRLPESAPGLLACTLQIDDGDLAVSSQLENRALKSRRSFRAAKARLEAFEAGFQQAW